MAVAPQDNAIFSGDDDMKFVRRNLGIPEGETKHDDDLITIINQISDTIEKMLIVENGGVEYKGVIKAREFTNIVFTGSGNQNCDVPVYPLNSVSSLQYTIDYTNWIDYSAPHIVLSKYRIHLPNCNFSKRAAATRGTFNCGYAVIPGDVKKVAFQMIKKNVDEGGIKDLGKNWLGLKSEGIASQAASSASFESLVPQWEKELEPYKRPLFAYQQN